MRKTLWLVLIVAMFPFAAYAGIWGTVTGYVQAEAWSLVVGGIIGALGMLGASYKLWGTATKELGEFVWAVVSAVKAKSDGGKEITSAEMAKIIEEGKEIYPAVAAAIATHKKV